MLLRNIGWRRAALQAAGEMIASARGGHIFKMHDALRSTPSGRSVSVYLSPFQITPNLLPAINWLGKARASFRCLVEVGCEKELPRTNRREPTRRQKQWLDQLLFGPIHPKIARDRVLRSNVAAQRPKAGWS